MYETTHKLKSLPFFAHYNCDLGTTVLVITEFNCSKIKKRKKKEKRFVCVSSNEFFKGNTDICKVGEEKVGFVVICYKL